MRGFSRKLAEFSVAVSQLDSVAIILVWQLVSMEIYSVKIVVLSH
jgi:hypothetical protein